MLCKSPRKRDRERKRERRKRRDRSSSGDYSNFAYKRALNAALYTRFMRKYTRILFPSVDDARGRKYKELSFFLRTLSFQTILVVAAAAGAQFTACSRFVGPGVLLADGRDWLRIVVIVTLVEN